MPESNGIIHSFQQRRQLEQDFADLAATNSQAALTQGVQRMVEQYSGEVLLTAVLRHLGTSSSQWRGGRGQLCALLPHEDTAVALRGVAGNRGKNPQERTTAALILERYLEQPVAGGLLAAAAQGPGTIEPAFPARPTDPPQGIGDPAARVVVAPPPPAVSTRTSEMPKIRCSGPCSIERFCTLAKVTVISRTCQIPSRMRRLRSVTTYHRHA